MDINILVWLKADKLSCLDEYMKNLPVLLIMVIFAAPSYAEIPLQGTFTVAGPVDSSGELYKGNSHVHFKIVEESAKLLFDSLEGAATDDLCTGLKMKSKANLYCYEIEHEKKYECGFSINLDKNRTEASQVGAC